jgi:glycosyltransferase involved in cell wall biosynthesis
VPWPVWQHRARVSEPPGVNVLGFLREAKGIGEAARLYARALETAGVPVRTGALQAGNTPLADGAEHTALGKLRGSRRFPVNLVCLNAPELQRLYDQGGKLPRARRSIGVWAWEVDVVPPEWAGISAALDEIWVYSHHVADILGLALPVPVAVVPLPVVPPRLEGPPDPRTADGFSFLFLFDFHSMLERKNPLGAIEAFARAFAPGEGPRLVVKSFNGDQRPEDLERLRAAVGDRPDIEVIDEYLDRGGRDRLIAGCDSYVSLHRSEGFGLTLAEAMAFGKPVIATGYSGNLDFMSQDNSYLVDHSPTHVGPGVEVYPAEATWAEPDLDHAAQLMRRVYEEHAEAFERGRLGQTTVEERLSPEVVGAVARQRVERLTDGRPGRLGRLWAGR